MTSAGAFGACGRETCSVPDDMLLRGAGQTLLEINQ
jgi:hypothetical protein